MAKNHFIFIAILARILVAINTSKAINIVRNINPNLTGYILNFIIPFD